MTTDVPTGRGSSSPMRPPKQEALVAAARVLFLRHGIRKTRVEAICADARVSKRTYYRYYRDKDEIAVDVLRELTAAARGRLEVILDRSGPIEETVRSLLEAKTELASATSAAFYREALDDSTAAGRFVLEARREWDERVRHFYTEAQARGEIRDDVDVDLLMAILFRWRDMAGDPDLLRLAPSSTVLVEAVMSLAFYGLVRRTDGAGTPPSAPERDGPNG